MIYNDHVPPVEAVERLKPYKITTQKPIFIKEKQSVLKLDWNESTIPPSPAVIRAITEFVWKQPLNWYPDVNSQELRDALSEYTGLGSAYITTFNGSDSALEYLARVYLDGDSEVIVCCPTYDNFRVYAESTGAKIANTYYSSPFIAKPKKIYEKVNSRTSMIYLVSPNNPTGILYTEAQIRAILERYPRVMTVVDEAYFEFCGITMASLVKKYNNIVVVRSFSKAFGLAGLRCAYILTDPVNLEYINRIRVGKNVNALAQVAALAALEDLEYTNNYVEEIKKSQEDLAAYLVDMGLHIMKTPANYLLVRVANPKQVLSYLEAHSIFVRDRSYMKQLEGYLRITIGTREQMEVVKSLFARIPSYYLFEQAIGRQEAVGS